MRGWLLALVLAAGAAPVVNAATVFVDTGHSAARQGAVAQDGTGEHELNRQMALQVIGELRALGHDVRDVEGEGYNRSLVGRVLDTERADLFISIHHDSIQPVYLEAGRAEEFAGFSVFVSGQAQELDGSLRCAITVGDAMRAAGQPPSLYHAEQVPGEGRPLLDPHRGIHRYDGLAVLRHAKAPAILLEVGVMVNPAELEKLRDPLWVARTGAYIAQGIQACTGSRG